VRFEVLIAVTTKRTIFWDVTSYGLVEVYWHIKREKLVFIFRVKE
jgi:hypothetical protein